MFRIFHKYLSLVNIRRIANSFNLVFIILFSIACDQNLKSNGIEVAVPKIEENQTKPMIKSQFENIKHIAISDVPKVFVELNENKKNESFAVFMFNGENGMVNIQFSFDNGKMGFDYVLLAPGNNADKNAFLKFTESKGFNLKQIKMNDVVYYRTEKGDLIELCTKTMTDFYGLSPNQKVELLIQY